MNFKIIHWSDLHIRLATRHKEYEYVIDQFAKHLAEEAPDLIVFTGDLFHNKVNMSPESFTFATYLFEKIHKIAPNVIIRGNHDENQGNRDRLDAISPFVELFNKSKKKEHQLFYLKDSGVHEFNKVRFFVYPNKEGEIPDITKATDDKINVGLFHGIMKGATTDNGYHFEDSKMKIPHEKLDAVMLGDIHKIQKLQDNMWYAGSIIQQNWGEDPIQHGYIKWQFDKNKLKEVDPVRVKNKWGYYKLTKTESGYDPQYPDGIPENATVRVIHPVSAVKDTVLEQVSEKYGVNTSQIQLQEEGIEMDGKTVNVQDDIVDLHNYENQSEIVKDYFKDDDQLEEIMGLNKEFFEAIELKLNSDKKRTIWGVTHLEFDNLFCYGENNYFNFENNQGCMGFFSPNRSGKSSLLDALTFSVFGETPHTSTYADIINYDKNSYHSKVKLYNSENRIFTIERSGRKAPSGITNSLSIKEHDQNGDVIYDESDMRSAQAKIEEVFGDAKTFEKTAYIYQDNDEKFLNLTPAKRKEWLYDNIGLEVFELLHDYAKKKSKDLKNHIDYLEAKDLSVERKKYRNMISEVAKERDEIQKEYDQLSKTIDTLRDKIEELQSKIKPVDDELEDQSEAIKNYEDGVSLKQIKIEEYENTTPKKDPKLVSQLKEKNEELEEIEESGYDTKLPEEENKEEQLKDLEKQGASLNKEIEELETNITFWEEKKEDLIEDWGTEEELHDEIRRVEQIEKDAEQALKEIERLEEREERLQEEVALLDTDERFENEELCQTCPLLEDVFGKKEELEKLELDLKAKNNEYEDLIAGDEDLEQLKGIVEEIEKCDKEIEGHNNDLKYAKKRRDDLRTNFKNVRNDLESLEKRRKEIVDQKIENLKTSIENIEQKIEADIKQKEQDIKDKISVLEEEKKKYERALKQAQEKQAKWEEQKKVIAKNKEIQNKIDQKKQEIADMKQDLEDLNEDLVEKKSDFKSYEDKIEEIKKEQEDLKESLEKYQIYDKYIKATHKNEIPLLVVENMLDVIQHQLNKVISQITDFRLRLFIDDSNIICNIIDDKGEREANRLSGMERFTSNLAFRFAIAQIGNMAIPDFIIVDEGFSAIDSTTSQEMPKLISFLKERFSFIMVVSHHEIMRDFVDFNIDIDNTGTFSQIQVD